MSDEHQTSAARKGARKVRQFESGATRDSDDDKLDIEGFMNPSVIQRFAEYMHLHRRQVDGQMRPSDNWQKGMSREVYMKSLLRHVVLDAWRIHREMESGTLDPEEYSLAAADLEDTLCATIFNAQGMLYELLVSREAAVRPQSTRLEDALDRIERTVEREFTAGPGGCGA